MLKKRILNLLSYSLLGVFLISIVSGCFVIKKFKTNFFNASPATLLFNPSEEPIHFEWTGDTLNGRYEAKTAILLETKIQHIPHNFWFQFDTGAQNSYIYENSIKSLRAMGIFMEEELKEGRRYIKEIEISVGGQVMTFKGMRVLENYGGAFTLQDSSKNFSIGTIGSDFINDKVAVINFREQTLQLFNHRDSLSLDKKDFHPFDFTGRRIMLPAIVDGKNLQLFYDSGCSAFGIITTKNRFKSYRNKGAQKYCYDANSWGNKMPICNQEANTNINFTSSSLPMRKVSYYDKYTFVQPLVTPFTSVGGWLGNQPFLDKTLILDTQKEEYAIQ